MRKRESGAEISQSVLLAEYESVYHYALTICHNETEAQDITQETFLKAMQSVKGFRGNSSLLTWLCTIAKNLWLNKCKKSNREVAEDEWSGEAVSKEKPIERLVVDKEIAKRIHQILHTMDEPYKEVFSLRVFGELPFADIAELFSKTESWARVTFYRGKKEIVEILEKEGLLG